MLFCIFSKHIILQIETETTKLKKQKQDYFHNISILNQVLDGQYNGGIALNNILRGKTIN
jgi:hypothetical protein